MKNASSALSQSTTKRAALAALGLRPVKLTAYERVKFASVAANDNASKQVRRVG